MRRTEVTIIYELTPEERADEHILHSVIENDLSFFNSIDQPYFIWECVKQTQKHRMQFDANYNVYYAKVHYEKRAA